jgi:hypothetical protein
MISLGTKRNESVQSLKIELDFSRKGFMWRKNKNITAVQPFPGHCGTKRTCALIDFDVEGIS